MKRILLGLLLALSIFAQYPPTDARDVEYTRVHRQVLGRRLNEDAQRKQ